MVVSTDSDWTRIKFRNAIIGITNFTIVLGDSAPGLSYAVYPSLIDVGKKQYDTTNVTIRFSALLSFNGKPAVLTIEKGAIGNTTLRLLKEEMEMLLIVNSGTVAGQESTNPRSFDISQILESLQPTVVDTDRLLSKPIVLSFYYPWYGNPLGRSRRLFHWEGITHKDISSSTFYPLLGPYDSYDADLIRAHMRLAKSSGVDSFVCSWWGMGSFEDKAFKEMLTVAGEENFTATVYYESFRVMSRQQIVEELSYVLKNYGNASSFLKLNDRPVIFVYAVNVYDRNPWFWKGILDEVKHYTGVDALFVADTVDILYLLAFDGLHTYNPSWISNLTKTYCDEAKSIRLLGKIWTGTVIPGYDDRKIRSPGNYIDRENGNYYNSTWIGAMASDPDMVLICTWNEWHEGTNIEPSREFQFDYLRLTRYWALQFKNERGVEPSSRPFINITSFNSNGSLRLSNNGTGDALAINLLLNSDKDYSIGNTIYVQVNETCKMLFIPLLEHNKTHDISIVSSGENTLRILGFYYSSTGERYSLESRTLEIGAKGKVYDVTSLFLYLALLIFGCTLILLLYARGRRS